jgi:hypothetical protein
MQLSISVLASGSLAGLTATASAIPIAAGSRASSAVGASRMTAGGWRVARTALIGLRHGGVEERDIHIALGERATGRRGGRHIGEMGRNGRQRGALAQPISIGLRRKERKYPH